MDDAIATVVMDRDMLRQLLFPRPKSTLKPRDREPLKRSRPVEKPKPDTKKVRNGECFNWHEGKCKSRACKFQHACAQCGSEKHHAAQCKVAKQHERLDVDALQVDSPDQVWTPESKSSVGCVNSEAKSSATCGSAAHGSVRSGLQSNYVQPSKVGTLAESSTVPAGHGLQSSFAQPSLASSCSDSHCRWGWCDVYSMLGDSSGTCR